MLLVGSQVADVLDKSARKRPSYLCGKGRWTIVPYISRLHNESNDKTRAGIELNIYLPVEEEAA